MLRVVRAFQAAAAVKGEGEDSAADTVHRRFQLLLASANEFLADSFLAEDPPGDDTLDIFRYRSALRHLRKSADHLASYSRYLGGDADMRGEDFGQSLKRLEDRVQAKRTNAHLSLARLQQKQPWCPDATTSWRKVAPVMQELDAAEALLTRPLRAKAEASPSLRPCQLSPHESSLLASVSKWK